jgi:hypothetical protein
MRRKATIGVGLGVTAVSLAAALAAVSRAGGGGGGTTGGDHVLDCLFWYFVVEIFIIIEFVTCFVSCDPENPSECTRKCLTRFIYASIIAFTLLVACIRYG